MQPAPPRSKVYSCAGNVTGSRRDSSLMSLRNLERSSGQPLLGQLLLPPFRLEIFVLRSEQQMQHSFVPIEKIFRDLVMFGFGIFDFRNSVGRKQVNSRIRIGEQDWRMSRDNQLGLMINQPMHQRQHAELPLRREGGLWFVQQIKPVSLKSVLEQGQKRLAVRLAMQRLS